MLFCTLQFLIFFMVVFVAYWALPWPRLRVWILLTASFIFYASWSPWLAWIVCVTSAIDYVLARAMDATERPVLRRWLLYASLAMNIGLLFYFKYANFFLDSLRASLRAAGQQTWDGALDIIIPIGISFYTFEAINYMVDVYRRRLKAERNLANFMLFILFFPHLVAGPIVRARDFLRQVNRRKRWDWLRIHLGMQYCLMGLFKKLAIADRMAQYADPVFANPDLYHTGASWIAVLAYSLQIYCDFSGYSDLALGTAHMLGYRLSKNFDMPYISANMSEFFRRWHISLSTWLRDYLFMPLTLRGAKRRGTSQVSRWRSAWSVVTGGSRGSRWRVYHGLLATMTVCGLWHGASWTLAVSGFLFGVQLVIHRIFEEFCEGRERLSSFLQTSAGTALRIGFTFLCISLTWVVFRAPTFSAAGTVFHRLFVPHGGLGEPLAGVGFWSTVVVVVLAHYVGMRGLWPGLLSRLPAPVRGFSYATALSLALVLAPEADKAFIYFAF